MKKLLLLLYILPATLLLAGCRGGNIFSCRRDMERLRPVQTLGLDRAGTGVTLSVSTGIGPDDEPALVMKTDAPGIETAITRLQDYSPEDELFYAHVRYILLGEDLSGESVLPLLDWVERSPAMRMDTPILLVKGSAAQAVAGTAGESTDITERLASLQREELSRGQHIYTLREIASSLLERGSALCLAVKTVPGEGTVITDSEAQADAVLPAGYAVLTGEEGTLTAYLTDDETLGAQLLSGPVTGAHISVNGSVLEIVGGSARAKGLWDENGGLSGILLCAELDAGVLERQEGRRGELEEAFRRAVEGCLTDAVARSQAMGCDYLDLERAVLDSMSARRQYGGLWSELFPTLPVFTAVEARIDRSYDLAE